jgi:site-specific recombinase XerD
VAANAKAKSELVSQIARLVRRARLDYDEYLSVCRQVRRKLGLRRPRRQKKLPQLLTQEQLRRFFEVIARCDEPTHEIMLKLLFYTAVRVSELVNIRVEDVDLTECKIFIRQGKGGKDRYILFPESFRLVLRAYLDGHSHNRFLFESQHAQKFTPRRIQQIVKDYKERAGLDGKVHPHLFRHQMLTYLSERGLTDAQIQLISGHESRKSLEVYQHLSLENVREAYQEAVRDLS